jgi:hypothetical protein
MLDSSVALPKEMPMARLLYGHFVFRGVGCCLEVMADWTVHMAMNLRVIYCVCVCDS